MNHGSKEINTLSALHFMKVITLCENKTPRLFHFPCDSFLLSLFFIFVSGGRADAAGTEEPEAGGGQRQGEEKEKSQEK